VKAELVKIKKGVDKVLAERWRQLIIENTPEQLRGELEIIRDACQCAVETQDVPLRIRLWELIHKIRHETFFSRTIPTLQAHRIQVTHPSDMREESVDWAQAHREALLIIAGDGTRGNGAVH
jgi:hypothetical protein